MLSPWFCLLVYPQIIVNTNKQAPASPGALYKVYVYQFSWESEKLSLDPQKSKNPQAQ